MNKLSAIFVCLSLSSLSLSGCNLPASQVLSPADQTLLSKHRGNPLSKDGQLITLILKLKSTQNPLLQQLPQQAGGYVDLNSLPFKIQNKSENTLAEGAIQDNQIALLLDKALSSLPLTLEIQLPDQQILSTRLSRLPADESKTVVVNFDELTIQKCQENCITLQNKDNTININGGNVCINVANCTNQQLLISPESQALSALPLPPMKIESYQIGAKQFSLRWKALSPQHQFTVLLNGVPITSAIPDSSYTFTQLQPNTQYTVQVQSLEGEQKSVPSAPLQVSTGSLFKGQILFSSNREGNYNIYRMNADGSNPVPLTHLDGDEVSAHASPDGHKILFTSDRNGLSEIFMMDSNGMNHERVEIANSQCPRWHPLDPTRLVYCSTRFDQGDFELVTSSLAQNDDQLLTQNNSYDAWPSWSPDGESLVFESLREGNRDLYILHVASKTLRRLSQHAANESKPAWSPSGSQIAFISDRDGNPEVYLMNLNNEQTRRLTYTEAAEMEVDWSPDGNHLLFTSLRDSNAEIYAMNADGSQQTCLTHHPGEDKQAHWYSME